MEIIAIIWNAWHLDTRRISVVVAVIALWRDFLTRKEETSVELKQEQEAISISRAANATTGGSDQRTTYPRKILILMHLNTSVHCI